MRRQEQVISYSLLTSPVAPFMKWNLAATLYSYSNTSFKKQSWKWVNYKGCVHVGRWLRANYSELASMVLPRKTYTPYQRNIVLTTSKKSWPFGVVLTLFRENPHLVVYTYLWGKPRSSHRALSHSLVLPVHCRVNSKFGGLELLLQKTILSGFGHDSGARLVMWAPLFLLPVVCPKHSSWTDRQDRTETLEWRMIKPLSVVDPHSYRSISWTLTKFQTPNKNGSHG